MQSTSLIPKVALDSLEKRFELGEAGKLNRPAKDPFWDQLAADQSQLDKNDWAIYRLTHAIQHAVHAIQVIQGFIPDDGDDDAGAIMWAGAMLSMKRARDKDRAMDTAAGSGL